MINAALCVAVAVTLTVIVNKTLRGYNLALILQRSLHFMVYPLRLTLRSKFCRWFNIADFSSDIKILTTRGISVPPDGIGDGLYCEKKTFASILLT